jgi:hypothetical protein
MSFPEFRATCGILLATCGILLGLLALVHWRKLPKKSEVAIYWAYIGLAFAVIGTMSGLVLRYLDRENYYGLILLVNVGWLAGATICIAIGLCKVYQDRQMRHRKKSLWLGAVCVIGGVVVMSHYCYRFIHFFFGG